MRAGGYILAVISMFIYPAQFLCCKVMLYDLTDLLLGYHCITQTLVFVHSLTENLAQSFQQDHPLRYSSGCI